MNKYIKVILQKKVILLTDSMNYICCINVSKTEN